MKIQNIIVVCSLTLGLVACDKGAQEACVSACEAADDWRDNCDLGSVNCEDTCEDAIKEAGGDECEDEQTAAYDCAAGIDFDDVGCNEDDLTLAIATECFAEALELGECIGGGYDTGSW